MYKERMANERKIERDGRRSCEKSFVIFCPFFAAQNFSFLGLSFLPKTSNFEAADRRATFDPKNPLRIKLKLP